jgi:hypothetical protein
MRKTHISSSSWDFINTIKPSACGFITAAELGQVRKAVIKISTGSKQLDGILAG